MPVETHMVIKVEDNLKRNMSYDSFLMTSAVISVYEVTVTETKIYRVRRKATVQYLFFKIIINWVMISNVYPERMRHKTRIYFFFTLQKIPNLYSKKIKDFVDHILNLQRISLLKKS